MKVPALAMLAVLAAPAAADTMASVVERAKLEVQPAGRQFKHITIENALGDIVVEGYDGSAIQIESNKQATDVEGLDRLRISLVPNPDGTVRITTTADRDRENKPMKRGTVRIDLKVKAPRDARIEATVSYGMLAMSNMDAGGDLESAGGTITVKNIQGELTTHSVSGPTSIVQAFGSIDTQTLSSDVDLDTITGERLIASANHGKIAGRRVRSRDVQLTTNDGKIFLEAEAQLRGRVMVASLKGDVEVRLHRPNLSKTALLVRASGTKVNFSGLPTEAQNDGWVQTRLGQVVNGALPTLVEMKSRIGMVQFAIVE